MNDDLYKKLVAANSLIAELRVEVDELKVQMKKLQTELEWCRKVTDI